MLDQKSNVTDFTWEIELIYEMEAGEKVYLSKDFMIVKLPEGRNALTTSWINGGYQENLEAVFNYQLNQQNIDDLETGSVRDFMKVTASRLGLNPEKVTGLITVASMKNLAIVNKSFKDVEVTTLVTAGIEVNGGRAGDPASYYEENGRYESKVGTINTILIVNTRLSESVLARAMMTAVEAKTVALQELMAPSKYSTGIATGSGTDKISVISNLRSENILTNAGKHSKLGELIGRSVIEATTEALARQSNLTPDSQRDMLVRLERFGVDEEHYWSAVKGMGAHEKKEFLQNLRRISENPSVVAMLVSILHIMDEINWGLIPEDASKRTAIYMMMALPDILGIEKSNGIREIFNKKDSILENWIRISSWCIKHLK